MPMCRVVIVTAMKRKETILTPMMQLDFQTGEAASSTQQRTPNVFSSQLRAVNAKNS
jgi:hypothetical protein